MVRCVCVGATWGQHTERGEPPDARMCTEKQLLLRFLRCLREPRISLRSTLTTRAAATRRANRHPGAADSSATEQRLLLVQMHSHYCRRHANYLFISKWCFFSKKKIIIIYSLLYWQKLFFLYLHEFSIDFFFFI